MERLKNTYKAPYFPVEYIGQFILEPFCSQMSTKDVRISSVDFLDVDHIPSSPFLNSTLNVTQISCPNSVYFNEVKPEESSVSTDFKHKLQMCLSSPETIRSKYAPSGTGCCLYNSTTKHHQIQAMIFPGVTTNRIEGILEGQFYMEALKEIRFHLSSNFFPPAYLLQSLLQQILEGNVDMNFLCEFISIMETLIIHHPPWQQSSIVSYYLGILQCSSCKKGTFFLLESLARSCVDEKEPCHWLSNQQLSISKLKPLYTLLLKYYFDLFEAELEALNKSCYENTNFGASRTIPPSVLAVVFLEYSDVMTNPVAVLLDCVLQATRAVVKKPNDRHLCETAYILHGILGVVVEYRLLINRLRGRSLSGQAWDDLQFYIPVHCQDYNQEEIEMLFKLMPSPWLQMFTAHAMYKQICYDNGIQISEKSFSLHQIISSYLIPLGRFGSCRKAMVKDPKGKKMGHWPCPQPLRPSLTLTSDRQKHVETLTIPNNQILPRRNSLKSKETKIESSHVNQNGAILLQQQDCLGKTPLDCPNAKEGLCTIPEVRIEDIAEGQFGNFNKYINSSQTELSVYLWSILLKNYIENHNLPLIYRIVNDLPLSTVQFVDNRFENLKNYFPEQLMVQYTEDVKTFKELPKYIQQLFVNLRNGSLALGVNAQLLLLHIESIFTNS
ncbi:SMC5-SMC6 complex localization factor protein 1 isoform X1 [Chiloscyllium plagiosum]|uniref:SMC5-SMC6 complex localization factor protein 1 isoform X1 n=1 Tax=Chiloscyllium plagiosum TaxID=36176 RepID=UPI001CB810FC|nr:SMC5-SMC6 complex localization factor protein 1 isoform X1 [Chiloscyllium plagiosum]